MRGRVKSIRPLLKPRVYLATGTPVSESPNNAFPILQVLSPEKVPGRVRWDKHFVSRVKVQEGPVVKNKIVSFDNLEELKRMLEAISTRRLKRDIRGMPDRMEDIRLCQPTVDQRVHYEEVMKGILAEIEGDPEWADTLDIACVKLLRARQVLNHPGVLELSGDSGKYRELDSLVDEILSDADAKLLIWTEWNRAVDLIADRYKSYGVITIDQRTGQKDLARFDKEFDYSDDRIVVATPAKGGVGIDFLSRARTAIYMERTYSLVNHRQSIDRIVRRVGDDERGDSQEVLRIKRIKRSPATILYLHVLGSVDDIVQWVLQRKLDVSDALLTSDQKLIEEGRENLIQMLRERVRIV